MMNKFSLSNFDEMKRWDDFVIAHPSGTAFHLSAWLKSIYLTYSLEPLLYVAQNESGEMSGIFPFFFIKSPYIGARIVSLPFSDYCGPLTAQSMEEENILQEIINRYRDKVSYIEIRGAIQSESNFIRYDYYKCHTLELASNPGDVMKKLEKKSIQYGIRKAQKSGIEIREDNTPVGMEEFYRLNRITRKKHGVPSQPLKFFKNLYDQMIVSGHSFILLAFDESRCVAAGYFTRMKDTIYYKYNASDNEYLASTKKTPNHLLTWTAIEKASQAGYKFFDFGRTSPDNTGLMRYKEMWGATARDLPYYYYPQIKGATSKEGSGASYRILTTIWRSLPDSIVETIEPFIYKHMA